MTLSWPLTFLRQGLICFPVHLHEGNVEKSFSQNVLKTNGWNLRWVIKVVKHFSYNKIFVYWGVSALAPGLYTCIKLCNFKCFLLWNRWAIFTRFHMGPSVKRVLPSCSNGSAPSNKMAAMPIYGKTLKNLLLQNQESFGAESWYIASRAQGLPSLFKWWP